MGTKTDSLNIIIRPLIAFCRWLHIQLYGPHKDFYSRKFLITNANQHNHWTMLPLSLIFELVTITTEQWCCMAADTYTTPER